MSEQLKAPFPWFGGKSRVADVVWRAFGNVPNYVEPFFGSGAVLLARPHESKIETINDADAYVANFWRAVTAAPEEVARHCDWPVNEADLHGRHRWLVAQEVFREKMFADPDFYDARVAGWWVWGLSQWIGGGWCHVTGSKKWSRYGHTRPDLDGVGQGVHKKMPNVSSHGGNGTGVHRKPAREHMRNGRLVRSEATPSEQLRRPSNKPHGIETAEKRPNVRTGGQGVHARLIGVDGCGGGGDMLWRKRPVLGHGGRGVVSPTKQIPALNGERDITARLPSLGNARGVHGAEKPPCAEWFDALRERLRRVRVCCGDWTRVLGDSVLGTTKSRNSGMNPCGVFLDPPYSDGERDPHLYAVDDGSIAAKVREWAIARGDDPDLRIAVCGYEGEHDFPSTWTKHAWKGHRGYAGEGNANVHRERIWFSPHCLPLVDRQTSLFGAEA